MIPALNRKFACIAAALVGLGFLASQTLATNVIGCGGTIVIGLELCTSRAVDNGNGTTGYSYVFSNGGSIPTIAYIPLLDPNAIMPGTLSVGVPGVASLITDSTAIAAIWTPASVPAGKEAFLNPPPALLQISFPAFTPGSIVSFTSIEPSVNGIIDVGGVFIDPPVPGNSAVPEPASLALLGAGLAGIGLLRRRRAA